LRPEALVGSGIVIIRASTHVEVHPEINNINAVGASETSVTTFSSDKEALVDMLLSIHKGKTQLPDFQRGWVWDDEHIRGLLANISLSFPIGAG
jgi:Protein of unknown function DUF262